MGIKAMVMMSTSVHDMSRSSNDWDDPAVGVTVKMLVVITYCLSCIVNVLLHCECTADSQIGKLD